MRIDGIPGFEFTGEFREPREGEWYWSDADRPLLCEYKHPRKRLILRKIRSTDLADYELTGEWRRPGKDEPFLVPVTWRGASAVTFGADDEEWHILREKRPGSAGSYPEYDGMATP